MAARIKVAAVTAAHGIKGEVKIKSLTEQPEDIARYQPLYDAAGGQIRLSLTGKGSGGTLIARIQGVSDRNEAELWVRKELFADASALPPPDEGEYYAHALIGMQVRDTDASFIGTVLALHNFGAGDILEIEYPDGKSEMFPFQDAFFPEIDMENRSILFIPPETVE